jgi:hypothetical protein
VWQSCCTRVDAAASIALLNLLLCNAAAHLFECLVCFVTR